MDAGTLAAIVMAGAALVGTGITFFRYALRVERRLTRLETFFEVIPMDRLMRIVVSNIDR